MFGLGAGEILVVGVIALIFIGPKKLPELARGLGRGIKEFQKAKNELLDEVNNEEFAEEQRKIEAEVKSNHATSVVASDKVEAEAETEVKKPDNNKSESKKTVS